MSELRAGERVVLVDRKERRYVLTLQPGASFHTHAGLVSQWQVYSMPEYRGTSSWHPTRASIIRR